MPGDSSDAARIAWLGALAGVIFVVWIATDVSANAGLGFFYLVPIGLATWWFGRRGGAIAIAGCVALYVVGDLVQPVSDFAAAFAVRLIAFIAVATIVAFLRERQLVLEHSAEELETIRAALTPSALPELPGLDAGFAFVASEFGVSGDFFLLTNGPDDSTVAIVGDVVGHGPRAARLATFIRTQFSAFVASTSDPAELLMLTNRALVDRPGETHELVSAICLRFQSEGPRLTWAVAGHPPPRRLPGLEEMTPVGATFLLGLTAGLELSNAEAVLASDEGVLAHTDGATDVRRDGVLLGATGLIRLLIPLARLPAQELAIEAEKAILDWTDQPIRDDLCLLVLRPTENQPPPPAASEAVAG